MKLHRPSKRKLLIVSLMLETSIFGLLGVYGYELIKTQKLNQSKKYATHINANSVVKPAETKLKYFYNLKPNEVVIDDPDWLKDQAVYNHNADGLIDRFNYDLEKDPKTFRIITVGDSFTYGQYVSTAKNWSEVLEDSLDSKEVKLCGSNKVEVLNLGVPGYDARYIAERYKLVGQKYKPDLIVWFEAGSGISRYDELMMPLIGECEQKSKNANSENLGISKDEHLGCWYVAEKEVVNKYSQAEREKYVKDSYQDFLTMTKDTPSRIIGFDWFDAGARSLILEMTAGFSQTSFHPIIHKLGSTGVLPDGHPSPAGHRAIAKTMEEYLNSPGSSICELYQLRLSTAQNTGTTIASPSALSPNSVSPK